LRAHFETVWRAVRRFGVPAGLAEDAAQEVFIIAAAKFDEIQIGKARQYLYAVAVRVAANFRRSSVHVHENPDHDGLLDGISDFPDAEALLDQKRQRELLDRVLDTLNHDLRTAFVLFELEDLSVLEIAGALQIPTGTVASRLRRAREQFGDALARAQRRIK
jgi:RNA polymerase sigma-70 factor (ECF subfamily)